jgi:raffinose/stachyose/melibiose transport system permease protein
MYFQSRGTTDWALIAAAVTIISVPIMIFYVLTQRYFIRGVASGALKE